MKLGYQIGCVFQSRRIRCGEGGDNSAVIGRDGRPSEVDRVAAWIRDAIVEGVRAPGSKLVERELADEFGVSRIPVREALKLLDGEGLVTLRPRTWAVVREFSPADIADLYEVRSAMEVLAFELAAQRYTRDGLEHLREVLRLESEGVRTGNAAASHRAAADFHEVVVELSGNRLLSELFASMGSRMRWLLVQHDDLFHVTAEHQELFDAIARRDSDAMPGLVSRHLETSRRLRDQYQIEHGVRRSDGAST